MYKFIYILTSHKCGSEIFCALLLTGLRTLCAVLGSALHSSVNALSVESSSDDVITHTGEISYTSAADKNDTVLLKLVPDSGNVGGYFVSVGKSYSGDFAHCGVRLFRGSRSYRRAHAALLGSGHILGFLLKSVKVLKQCGSLRLLSG